MCIATLFYGYSLLRGCTGCGCFLYATSFEKYCTSGVLWVAYSYVKLQEKLSAMRVVRHTGTGYTGKLWISIPGRVHGQVRRGSGVVEGVPA